LSCGRHLIEKVGIATRNYPGLEGRSVGERG
jgi:hypothetical protein